MIGLQRRFTNGHHQRHERHQTQRALANSAIVVNVRAEDFAVPGDPLGGLAFRRIWEQKAFETEGEITGRPRNG